MAESRWAQSQDGPRVKMGCCCLPPERGKITVNSKNETDARVKMGQGSRWTTAVYPPSPPKRVKLTVNSRRNKWQGQDGSRVKIGCTCLPPERVTSEKQERNKWQGQNGSRVKMGQKTKKMSEL